MRNWNYKTFARVHLIFCCCCFVNESLAEFLAEQIYMVCPASRRVISVRLLFFAFTVPCPRVR